MFSTLDATQADAQTQALVETIQSEITQNTIMIYSKGSDTAPRCGFTMETAEFFRKLGVPFVMQDVLDQPEKRQVLSEMTQWPTLPKVFINQKFYGDTDILAPMLENGELEQVLREAFGDKIQN
jgi:monothiol glutaredoxin